MINKKIFIKINQDFAFSNFLMRGKKSNSIFFPGCSFMKFGNEMIYKVLDLLRKKDSEIEVVSLCCGYPSQVLDKKYYKKIRDKIVKFFMERNIERIYVACPNCYNILNKLKIDYNLKISLILIYKIINEKLEEINKFYPITDKVVIHDPCIVKNDKETYESVREILKKISQKFVEPINTKSKTVCCGNINMNHIINKKMADKICEKRVNDLIKESNVIVSYCNGCLFAFKKYNKNIIHIMELIFGRVNRDTFYKRVKFTMGLKKC